MSYNINMNFQDYATFLCLFEYFNDEKLFKWVGDLNGIDLDYRSYFLY
jgi:hypothetical protein